MERNAGREGERDRERRKACVPAFLSLANGKHWPNLSGESREQSSLGSVVLLGTEQSTEGLGMHST